MHTDAILQGSWLKKQDNEKSFSCETEVQGVEGLGWSLTDDIWLFI